MTFVSPFASAVPANIGRSTAQETRGESSDSFAGLLDDPAAFLQPRHMFAFDELGMFGRREVQLSPARSGEKWLSDAAPQTSHEKAAANITRNGNDSAGSPPQNALPYTAPNALQLSDMQNVATRIGAASASAEAALCDSTNGLPAAMEVDGAVLAMAASSALNENSVALENSDLNFSLTSQRAGNFARLTLPTPSNRAENPVTLLVSGSADALVIAARSQGETAEGFIRLRQLAEDTAADFGMDIAEFRLNGAASGLSYKSISGGQHGSRTR